MLLEKLLKIQNELKAPKGQYNNFGNYKYRSAEDILEAVKPICQEHLTVLTLSDDVVFLGDRYYIKATATLVDVESGESTEVTAFAREEDSKKGMDASQITGSCSSYARKYALNGLFCIDDTKDADTDEQHKVVAEAKKKDTKAKAETEQKNDPKITPNKVEILKGIINGKQTTIEAVLRIYGVDELSDLTESQYDNLTKRLAKTADKVEE